MREIPTDAVTPGPKPGSRPLNEKQAAAHPALERHYSIDEVAALWHLSRPR
jgi:hypothetical protein